MLSYHALMYGVLTARGMAAGKNVCAGLCALMRREKTGRSRKDYSEERSMTGKKIQGVGREKGWNDRPGG